MLRKTETTTQLVRLRVSLQASNRDGLRKHAGTSEISAPSQCPDAAKPKRMDIQVEIPYGFPFFGKDNNMGKG